MLQAINLSKKYKTKVVVKEVNVELFAGESVGLLGPNGAGKSTTISMLSSLVQPSSGDVLWNEKSIAKNPDPLRKALGVVPQEIALYPELSARENLAFFGRVNGLKGELLATRITEVLTKIGLLDRQKDIVKTFSGGMKRRLNIGSALLHKPSILIMDEPTVGIDPQSRAYILETVKQFVADGMTLLYTSHYMEEVEMLCDKIYIMDQGKIIAHGTKEELKELVSDNQTIELKTNLLTENFEKNLKEQFPQATFRIDEEILTISMSKSEEPLANIFAIAAASNVVITSAIVKVPSLEDVFLHLTGKALRD
ncbi:ABC-2 type transport system ATP-binding protein [Psychrobacillus psychrotolerans]|uniref:ABC-2 type transport system ATP-binding protein n=1 Tax=Psychrobacillus psychrotolerans TaxID=126156 RepID=A0A1I5ZP89_9BACI|nr:ABC transporter ATP-binding protein [Psychrobacillus psychrotolerans]SFQ58306.1 ABC-2 type transport system ATP-binding protein [Psychrobacillus psychrotolerans]